LIPLNRISMGEHGQPHDTFVLRLAGCAGAQFQPGRACRVVVRLGVTRSCRCFGRCVVTQ